MSGKLYRMRDLASTKGRKGVLPVSPATIWRWVKKSYFPAPFKLGEGVTCWDPVAVDKFIAARVGARHE